jgi:hypothetical protein
MARPRVVRKERVSCCEHRDQQVVEADRNPGDPGELRVLGDREELGGEPDAQRDDDRGQHDRGDDVGGRDRGDRPEEERLQGRGALPGEPGDQHATGEAAVEQQREGDVTVGVAALADHLDGDRAQDGDHDRDPGGGGAGEQADRDAGDGDVPEPVAEQR